MRTLIVFLALAVAASAQVITRSSGTTGGGGGHSNGANCSSGNAPLGVDENGAVEGCFDVEEETHAAEHSDGGTDEITVENLATACTDAQVVGGDGAGGLECQTDQTGAGSTFLDCSAPSELTIATGAITVTSGGGCFDVDTESDAASDTLTTINCTAGDAFTLKPESDARTVVLDSTSFFVDGATNQSLDQDGDYAIGFCLATNTPVIFNVIDEAGTYTASQFSATGAGSFTLSEISAPGAAATAGNHNFYFDSADSLLKSHENGGSAVTYVGAGLTQTLTNKTISGDSNTLSANTHATDCTAESGSAAGQMCHELDDDTFYVYDGAAWDQIGAGGGSTCGWAVIPLSLPGEDNGSANPGANVTNTNNPGEGRDTNGTVNTGAYLFLNAGGTVYFKFEVPHNWSNSCGEIGVQFTGRSAGANGTQVATFDVQIGSGDENTDHAMSPDAPTGGATALSDNTNINSMSWSGALDDETINAGFAAVMSVSRDASDTDVNTVYILSGAVFIPIDNSVNPY